VSDLRFFEELGVELERAATRTLPDSGDPEPNGRRPRARGAASLGVAVAVTLAIAVGAFLLIGGVRHRPSPTPQPPVAVTPPGLPLNLSRGQSAGQRYIDNAWLKVERDDPGCVPRQRRLEFSDGAPSRALLSSLAVLRRSAAAPEADFAFEHLSGPALGTPVYRRYAELARVVTVSAPGGAGLLTMSYYLLPAGNVVGGVPPAARCYEEQAAALQAELPNVRPSLRGSTVRLAAQERYDDQHPEGVGVEVLAGGTGGTGGGGPGDAYAGTTTELERSGLTGAAVPLGAATIVSGIVPDRVAKVTLDYPPFAGAGRAAPAFSVSAHPVSNVFVASLPRGIGVAAPEKITWHAADGSVIKVIHQSPKAGGS
jgi:hypothetical protein